MQHIPVLLGEVLEMLEPQEGQRILDLTLGAGGHFRKLKEAVGDSGKTWAVDRDLNCIEAGKSEFSDSTLIHGHWMKALTEMGDDLGTIDGVLIDCGVSSMHLDTPERGFSFRFDGPLDMRMNATQGITAQEVLEHHSEQEIADIIYKYGEEHRSRAIAKAIVRARKEKKLETTFDLVDAIQDALGPKRGKRHPGTKTFQALRMYVNQELELLEEALSYLIGSLKSGAKITVITFHSLEDRLTKHLFRQSELKGWVKRINKKAIRPAPQDVLDNKRARSAILRGVEIV